MYVSFGIVGRAACPPPLGLICIAAEVKPPPYEIFTSVNVLISRDDYRNRRAGGLSPAVMTINLAAEIVGRVACPPP